MSSLAIFLKQKGNEIKGADTTDYIFTQEELSKHHIEIESLEKMQYQESDLVVLGNSFVNLEIKNKPTISYPDLLSSILNDYVSIAVSGSHGKTSTATYLSQLLSCSNIIGDGTSACKDSPYFVFEACEYKRVFLHYQPDYLMITNVDYDHVDYYKSEQDYRKAFLEFIKQAKKQVIVNGDDGFLKTIPSVFKYGLDDDNDIQAKNIITNENGITFDLYIEKCFVKNLSIKLYGIHNLMNILGCISILYLLEKPINIDNLIGAKRRFQETIYKTNVFIDDYGHHPTEIKATLDAIKQKYPRHKIVIIFKPDRYSRIKEFGQDFIRVFKEANESFIMPFPSCSVKEEGIDIGDDYLQTLDSSLVLLNKDFSRFKNYENYVFLMSSSKNVNTIKEEIIKEMKK